VTQQIVPADWQFTSRKKASDIKTGDRLRVYLPEVVATSGSCGNCLGLEQVFSRVVRSSGPVTYVDGRKLHVELQQAPCPVCQGEQLQRWLEQSSGLEGLYLDGKHALDVRVASEHPLSGQEEAFKIAWALLSELPAPKTWALFSGDYGRGKSHILVGLVNGCRLAGVWAQYVTTEQMLERIRSTYDPMSAMETTAEVRRHFELVPVLVVDELDRVKWTEWAGEKLVAIFNQRYLEQRSTVFASNLGPQALAKKVEPLAALVSRISSGHVVTVGGPDLRPGYQPGLPELPGYLHD